MTPPWTRLCDAGFEPKVLRKVDLTNDPTLHPLWAAMHRDDALYGVFPNGEAPTPTHTMIPSDGAPFRHRDEQELLKNHYWKDAELIPIYDQRSTWSTSHKHTWRV